MAQLLIQVPDKLKANFKLICNIQNVGMSSIVIKMLTDFVNENKEKISISELFDNYT